jgi:hypothetical protein
MLVSCAISRIVGGIGIDQYRAVTDAAAADVTAPLLFVRMQNKRYLEVVKASLWAIPAAHFLRLHDVSENVHQASEMSFRPDGSACAFVTLDV